MWTVMDRQIRCERDTIELENNFKAVMNNGQRLTRANNCAQTKLEQRGTEQVRD